HTPPTSDLYPLSLHDALPIFIRDVGRAPGQCGQRGCSGHRLATELALTAPLSAAGLRSGSRTPAIRRTTTPAAASRPAPGPPASDRKSTRLNSSHLVISYAVF